MKPRHQHRWILWLLPLMVARALVPTGFMFSAGEHGLGIVMCPGNGPVPDFARAESASLHAHGGHHADHAQHGGHGDAASGSVPCVYALAGSACATVACATDAIAGPGGQKFILPADPALRATDIVIDRIRGPPLA